MSALSTSSSRENMLKSQILTGNVLRESVLDALLAVPREQFVPPSLQGVAYLDEEIPLAGGRFLMEPLAFARMLEKAAIGSGDVVLDIGCATGYSSAVLAQIARHVVAVEEEEALAAEARKNLSGISNASFVAAPLAEGSRSRAPYDVICIEGATEYVPQALADQLKEGGRLLTFEPGMQPRIGTQGLGMLVEYKKIQNQLYRTPVGNASVAHLPQFSRPLGFEF